MELKKFSENDFKAWESRYRAHFFNSVVGFKSLALCGSRDQDGNTNLAVINSVVHIGANPPLMGMIIRPATVPRHTLTNIIENDEYTFNHIREDMVDWAHQTSAKYLRGQSEYTKCGFTEYYSGNINAPYVAESTIKIGLRFKERINIRSNHTIMMIGEVVEVILPEDVIGEDGFVDLQKAGSMVGSGLDAYLKTSKIKRMAYAQPDRDPEQLEYR